MKIIPLETKKLRFFDIFYNKDDKEFYIALWFWLIVFYRSDVK